LHANLHITDGCGETERKLAIIALAAHARAFAYSSVTIEKHSGRFLVGEQKEERAYRTE